MSDFDRDAILADATALAAGQPGGTLATTHAEDGTPYVTFVLFHLRANGELLFGSQPGPQHARNIEATREVSFLVDNREVVREDWTAFDRVVIEGRAREVKPDDPRHAALLAELAAKSRMAAYFTEHGRLYCVAPRRLILMKGFEATRYVVDFAGD